MRIKLFGLTVIEVQKEPADDRGLPKKTTSTDPRRSPSTPLATARASDDLHASAAILPRTHRGTIDIAASLQRLGITDPDVLWTERFRPGSVGSALKCILAPRRGEPSPSALAELVPDLHACAGDDLPLAPATGKIDVAACLNRFGIQDPAVLWTQKFGPRSAGGRLKMFLRASGYVPPSASADDQPSTAVAQGAEARLIKKHEPSADSQCQGINPPGIQRSSEGSVDFEASLQALGITDPKGLWEKQVVPGSAKHVLKREIARALARRETVAGITRQDIGLTD